MRLRDLELTAIDFEATGTVGELPSEPWQLGLARFARGRLTGETWESLLRVGDRPFNPYAPGQHHVLREVLATAPTLGELWPQWRVWCEGRVLLAHNLGTERTFLRQAAPLHQFGPWLDTLTLSRYLWPELSSHALEELVAHFGLGQRVQQIVPGRQAHDALFDAAASGALLEHILAQPGWADVTLEAALAARPRRRN